MVEYFHVAAGGGQDAGQDLEQGRLTGARWPHDDGDLTTGNGETDIFEYPVSLSISKP
jgi:hypothetical protein